MEIQKTEGDNQPVEVTSGLKQGLGPHDIDKIMADLQVIADALSKSSCALKGIITAETVEEITHEHMNDAELSIGPAIDALNRITNSILPPPADA